MENIQMRGAILDLPVGAELDYRLGNDTSYKGIPISKLPNIVTNDKCFNQLEFEKEFGNMLCTQYFAITMHSNNTNKPISLPIRHQLCENRVKLNFSKTEGGYLVDGIKNTINTLKDGIMYRINKSDVKILLDKGYVVGIGMYTGVDVNTARTDGKITNKEIEEIKNAKYGHATCLRKNIWLNSYEGVIANNKVEIEDVDTYIDSWIVYDWAYLIISNDTIRKYFYENTITGDYKKDANLGVELMKNKEIFPREFEVYQKLINDIYIKRIDKKLI